MFRQEIVEGLESGPRTYVFKDNGLRASLKLANGGLLTHDAARIVYSVSFDADDNVTDVQILEVHGPHPGFVADVWCKSAIEALGI